MAERKPAKKTTSATARTGKAAGFTAEERAAMKERARELKEEARATKDRAAGERAVLEKIAEMQEPDRAMAERLHAIVTASAPGLSPKTWYGMPAYARDGKVVCFFQSAEKFKSRYATLGFSDEAMTGWFRAAGLEPDMTEHLAGGELTVTLWRGVKGGAIDRKAA